MFRLSCVATPSDGGYETDDSDFSAMSGVTEAEDDLDDLLMAFRPEMPVSRAGCVDARTHAPGDKPGTVMAKKRK